MYYGDMFDMHHRNRKLLAVALPVALGVRRRLRHPMGFGIFATLLFTFFLFGGNPHHFWWASSAGTASSHLLGVRRGRPFVGGGYSVTVSWDPTTAMRCGVEGRSSCGATGSAGSSTTPTSRARLGPEDRARRTTSRRV